MTDAAAQAATLLWTHWQKGTRLDALPAACRPATRADGYAVQQAIVAVSGQQIAGWKIAATSAAGQRHIGVDGPLAGPILSSSLFPPGAEVPLDGNIMRVAEAEFAFRFARPLTRRPAPYTQEDVLAAVDALHPSIEIPDSRYDDFARVGAPQLIADTACSRWFVLGPAERAAWRSIDLTAHRVAAFRNGERAAEGSGANVLGDPRVALTWLVNELCTYGDGVEAGQFVTTGTCVVPVPISPGDRVRAEFGVLGAVEITLR